MGGRIDELQGRAKEGLGNLTGDDDMAREGQAEAATAKLGREAEGAIDQGVGKVQEALGDAMDDEEMQARGKARELEGDAKRAG